MGKIIAVVSGKGGTGKTTFTSCIGFALASMGKKVLCLDCDISLRNLDLALGLSDSALMDFSDVLSGRCTLEQAVVSHPKYPSLFLLAAPLAYDGFRVEPEQAAALMGEIIAGFHAGYANGKVHLVVNRVAKKLLRQLHTTIDDAMDAAGLPLLGVVPEDGDIPRCLNQGVPLCDDNYYAARAFYNIARRIAGYKIPLMKI